MTNPPPRHRRPTNLTLLALQIALIATLIAASLAVGVLWTR